MNREALVICRFVVGVITNEPVRTGTQLSLTQFTVIEGLRSFAQAPKSNMRDGEIPEIWHGISTPQKAKDAGPVMDKGAPSVVLKHTLN